METTSLGRMQDIQKSLVKGDVVPSGRIAEKEKGDIQTARDRYIQTLETFLDALDVWGTELGAPPVTPEQRTQYIDHAKELVQRYIVTDNRAHRSADQTLFTLLTPTQQNEILTELIDNYNRTNGLFDSTTVASRASLYRDAAEWVEIQGDENIPQFYKTPTFLKRLAQSYIRPREAITEFERIVDELRSMEDVPDEFKKDWILRSIATHDPKKAVETLKNVVTHVQEMQLNDPTANQTELIQAAVYAPTDPTTRGRQLAHKTRAAAVRHKQQQREKRAASL